MNAHRKLLPAARYIPVDSIPYTRKGVDAVVYWYESKGRYAAIAYHGKATKPDWHYWYRNHESRQTKTEEHFENIASHAQRMQERAEKRKA
jgi:elongation factor P hydroxylase